MDAAQTGLANAMVLLPAVAGALLLLAPGLRRVAWVVAAAGSAGALAAAALLLVRGASGVWVVWEWAPDLLVRVAWRIGPATLALVVLISGVGVLVVQFAGAYFGASHKGRRAIGQLCLFEAAMLGLVLADDLLLLYTFWELTGLASFFLINTDAEERDDTFAAAQQALLITVGGALPMLVGFLVLALATGTASLSELARADVPLSVQTLAFALILPGILTKSAQVPFHFWLPGAMAAPTPVSAYLHSATMVKAGILLLLFLFPVCGGSPLWSAALVPLGAATCIWGSYRALGEDDVKLLMAWSTVSQLGLMAITAGLGSDLAIRAATLYLFAHALFKAGLFLSIGAIDHSAHTRSLAALGGLRRRAPLLCAVVLVLAGSMAGLPPFAGFLSKELVLKKLLLADALVHDVAVIGIVLGSIGTVAYTARFFFGCFTGAPRSEGAARAEPVGALFLLSPALLAALSLAGGLGAPYTDRWLLEPVSASLLGYALDAPELALWHGINTPLVLSLVILSSGFALHRWLGSHRLPRGAVALEGPRLFERFLAGAQSLGGLCNRLLAGAQPRVYFALTLGLGLALSLPLWPTFPAALVRPWRPAGVVILVVQVVALALLVRLTGKVARILSFTIVGLALALLFTLLSAPDLVLTQLLVEVLTTVFFLLAARFVASERPRAGPSRRGRTARLAVAVPIGLAMASLAASLALLPHDDRLPDWYFEAAPTLAKGRNLVNVVLVDFRGIDTAIETLVVLLASLGVLALLLGRELPEPGDGDGEAP